MFTDVEKEGFIKVFETLRLYKRITSNKLALDEQQEGQDIVKELYVDLLPNNGILRKLLSNNTFILLGRKGTGKSTLFARAQYDISIKKQNLSAYINAKSIVDDMKSKNSTIKLPQLQEVFDSDQLERLFLIRQFINELFKSIVEDLKKEDQGFFERMQQKFRDNKIEQLISSIKEKIDNPTLFKINSVSIQKSKIIESKKDSTSSEVKSEASFGIKEIMMKLYSKLTTTKEKSKGEESETVNVFARLFDVAEIINDIKELLKVTGRSRLFIFIDDFSELSSEDMDIFFQTIINPIYGSAREELILKIAAYPGRISFGELEAGKFDQQSIDAFELYGRHYVNLEKKSSDYIMRLLENRISYFCKSSLDNFFDYKDAQIDEYCLLLYEATNNIPRTLGHILSFCYDNAIVYDKKINKGILFEAIEQVYKKITKTYFEKEYKSLGVYEEKIDSYSQYHLLEALCDRSLELKAELPKTDNTHFKGLEYAYSSHFQVATNLSAFLDSIELNGLVHKVSILAQKGAKEGQNPDAIIYSLDYGLCLNKKILYGRPERTTKYTKYYQQRRFDFSSLIIQALSSNKKIICKNCGAEYDITELASIEKFHMMCMGCGHKSCEVKYNQELKNLVKENLNKATYYKEELDILHVVGLFTSNSGIKPYPLEVGQELDTTYQSVARIAKGLIERCLMTREEDSDNKNRPYYKLTDKGKEAIQSIY
ncbi:hypothetical protein BK143_08810 [Paenibacillus peoriae]|uniref:hypothetical protein n=1 Tax=Paenibacillus peoriae TaxID=59893 RepID=UPI00096F19CA|nr:hypothetical protein [Paenibacillus peoriae]OMF73953.1 hypothetical protein BK143_08810 [Paenibacillus peoriae]